MELPELPKQKKKREASITPAVLAWFRKNYPSTCLIEIKYSRTRSIAEKAVLPHQKQALMCACSDIGVTHKLTDEARRQQPCDAFHIVKAEGLVVACFKRTGTCYIVPIEKWRGIRLADLPTSGSTLSFEL